MVFVVVVLLILILLTLASISSKLEEALSGVRNKGTILAAGEGDDWLSEELDKQNPLPPKPRKKQAVKKTTTLRKAQVRGANGRFAAKAK